MNTGNNDEVKDDQYIEKFNTLNTLIINYDKQSLLDYLNNKKTNAKVLNMLISSTIQHLHQNPDDCYMIIELLLQNGADINYPIHLSQSSINEKEHITLLMYSLLAKDIQLFRITIKYNPDVSLRDTKNLNAILYFVLYNHDENVEILESLIEHGADVNSNANVEVQPQQYEWHSVFTMACLQRMQRSIKVLIENNVYVNFETHPSRNTGLHITLNEDYDELTEMLYKVNGIRLDIANSNGVKAIDIAEKKGKMHFIRDSRKIPNESITASDTVVNENNEPGEVQREQQALEEKQHQEVMEEEVVVINNNQHLLLKQQQSISNHEPHFVNIRKTNTNNTTSSMNFNYNSNNNNHFQSNHYKATTQYGYHHNYYFNKGRKNMILQRNKLEIPLEFKAEPNSVNSYPNTTDAFLKISNPPLLCLDLSDITIDLEAKLAELSKTLQEEEKKLKKSDEDCNEFKEKLSEIERSIAANEIEIASYIKMEEENLKEISDLRNINNLLNNKFITTPLSSDVLLEKFKEEKHNLEYSISLLQKDLMDYCTLNKHKINQRKIYVNDIINSIQSILNDINPDYEVVLYGSYATGLCLPWSDIDLVLSYKVGKAKQNNYLLGQLYNKLITKDWVKEPKYIETTAIPIIKLISTQQSFEFKIDISIREENHMGLKCVELVKDYINEYAVLEPIVLALKTILQNANLNNPYKGGLSSYGTILMVVSHIQNQIMIDNNSINKDHPLYLGYIFYSFLHYFGKEFDYKKYIILTYTIEDSRKADSDKPEMEGAVFSDSNDFIIMDPLNKKNNVAKSTHQFMNIKLAFLLAFLVINEGCECGCHYDGGAIFKHDYYQTEHCLLKRMFNAVKRYSDDN